ncbi:MAG: V-type ATP synthase subunit D [Candidatus Anstonellales archaeon]
MAEQIIPTRMELMKIKQRIALASKGHGLLKKKRDALIIELFKVLKKAKDMRKMLNEMLKHAYKLLYFSLSETSEIELRAFASGIKLDYNLKTETKNIMGVKLMVFNFNINEIKKPEHISPLVDETSNLYIKILEYLVKTAEIESVVKKLLKEIEKTKRRVNALEYNIIPKLEEEKKLVVQKIEELERDSFMSLKTIKRRLSQ